MIYYSPVSTPEFESPVACSCPAIVLVLLERESLLGCRTVHIWQLRVVYAHCMSVMPDSSATPPLGDAEGGTVASKPLSTSQCDLCSSRSNAKNKLHRLTQEESLQLSDVVMPETSHVGGHGTTPLHRTAIENPLKKEIMRRESGRAAGVTPALISLCAFCMRMLSGMRRPGKRRRNDDDESRVCKFRRRANDLGRRALSSKCFVCELHSKRSSLEKTESTRSLRVGYVGALHACSADMSIRPRFASEFARRTYLPLVDIDRLLTEAKAGSQESVLCNVHKQLVRRTVDAIRLLDAKCTCFIPGCRAGSDLRPLRVPENEAEALELEKACRTLVDGMSLSHLRGKRVCPGHRLAITRTISNSALPQSRSEGLVRWLRRIAAVCLGTTEVQPDVI